MAAEAPFYVLTSAPSVLRLSLGRVSISAPTSVVGGCDELADASTELDSVLETWVLG